MYKHKIYTDYNDLFKIKSFWETNQFHPNHDLDHFKLICQIRKNVIMPVVIAVFIEQNPRFVLIGRLEKNQIKPTLGYFKLPAFPVNQLTIIHQGFLGQLNEKLINLVMDKLIDFGKNNKVGCIRFSNFDIKSIAFKKYEENGMSKFNESLHWTMDIPNEFDIIKNKLKKKHLKWINNRKRKLNNLFDSVEVEWIKDFTELEKICRQLENVASKSYQRALGTGFYLNDEFFKRMQLFDKKNMLRMAILKINNEIKGYWYGELYKNTFYSDATAYVP